MKFENLLLLGFVITSSWAFAASPNPNVFGDDDRKKVRAKKMKAPLHNIVRLSSGCTGSFVGDRLILTAGHCVYDTSSRTLESDLKVYYKYDREDYEKVYTADLIWADHYTKDTSDKNDWAIILIKEERDSHYFGLRKPTLPLSGVSVAGYSSDLEKRLGLHQGCNVFTGKTAENFKHDCDTTRGASGAPIYFCKEEDPTSCYVVGVHIGGFRDGGDKSLFLETYSEKYGNDGVPMDTMYDLIIDLRSKYNSE